MKATCVLRFKDKKTNKIIGYRLMDKNRMYKDIEPDILKEAIRRSEIKVDNLTLTADNRIVTSGCINDAIISKDDTYKFQPTNVGICRTNAEGSITDEKIIKLIDKARKQKSLIVVDGKREEYKAPPLKDNEKVYIIISKSTKEILVYIADGAKEIGYFNETWRDFSTCDKYYKFKTKIVGGKGLTRAYRMFAAFRRKCLDISELDTSNVNDMESMFAYAKIDNLIGLEKLNTSKVKNMEGMFLNCSAILCLSNFDTSNVQTMEGMFQNYDIENTCIDLSRFNTSKLETSFNLFNGCRARQIINFDGKYIRNE